MHRLLVGLWNRQIQLVTMLLSLIVSLDIAEYIERWTLS
jgi:hypothetical protein